MNFELKGTVENLIKSGTHAKGEWYLYSVKEKLSGDKSKTWRIFCSNSLSVNSSYNITGYITESPNKMFMNQQGKHAYQTSYNATSCNPIELEIPFF